MHMLQLLSLSLLGLGCSPSGSSPPDAEAAATMQSVQATPVTLLPADTAAALALSRAFRWAAERVLPSVVSVSVERSADSTVPRVPVPDALRQFFSLPDEQLPLPPAQRSGTGFVFDAQGHVLTARHVVVNGDRFLIRLRDGREFPATLTAADPLTDLAVLTIDGAVQNLVAPQGNSDSAAVGDWVLALGNPLGLDFTVTAGIVSATGRQLTGRATALESFIQTDAAINPGNSGGPLIDVRGRVIGINSAISGGSRFVGYGFAVPINLARRVVSDLLTHGRVRRPRLGVRVSDVTAIDAEVFGLPRVFGADVAGVEPGSPAARAGLLLGDVIIALNGTPVRDATALTTGLAALEPGARITLTLIRNREQRDVTVTLGEFADTEDASSAASPPDRPTATLDFTVAPLSAPRAEQLGVAGRTGVLIASVAPWSGAARAGLAPGQVLVQINGQPVASPADVARLAAAVPPGSPVSLRVIDAELGETLINYRRRR